MKSAQKKRVIQLFGKTMIMRDIIHDVLQQNYKYSIKPDDVLDHLRSRIAE